jgi:hypothetical protein
MHELIATAFLGEYFLLRPGAVNGVKLPCARYEELASAPAGMPCPSWTAEAARRAFGLDLTERRLAEAVLVCDLSPLGYSRASYELNLGGATGTASIAISRIAAGSASPTWVCGLRWGKRAPHRLG